MTIHASHFTITPGTVICMSGDIDPVHVPAMLKELTRAAGHDKFLLLVGGSTSIGLHGTEEIMKAIREALTGPDLAENAEVEVDKMCGTRIEGDPMFCAYCQRIVDRLAISMASGSTMVMNGHTLTGSICPSCLTDLTRGTARDARPVLTGDYVTPGTLQAMAEHPANGVSCACGRGSGPCPGIFDPTCGIYPQGPK